jgi:acetate kinase
MKQEQILAINGGSSSIKFTLYGLNETLQPILSGSLIRIGLPDATFSVKSFTGGPENHGAIKAGNIQEAVSYLLNWFNGNHSVENITAVGHRIVHGMNHKEAVTVSTSLLNQLMQNIAFDPDHLPIEIELMKAFALKHPVLPQVACFDTSFHRNMPDYAKRLPIPGRFDEAGIQRYGFHGISYSYLLEKLAEEKSVSINSRIIMAHLGSGASMVAVKNGQSIDTSMGFTPAGGFPMSTRSGDLDPGVIYYMMKKESMTAEQLNDVINRQSGLLGISETSPDMKDLLKIEKSDKRAADAVNIFCYQIKKWIGSFAAALGGLDIVVFSGGIGENAPVVRSRICEGLGFLGIELDEKENEKSEKIISAKKNAVVIYVIPTNEEWMIAKTVCRVLAI